MADADFAAVQKWKVPLLQKAAKRLCTDPHFQFMRVELFKFRRENGWVEARRPPCPSSFRFAGVRDLPSVNTMSHIRVPIHWFSQI